MRATVDWIPNEDGLAFEGKMDDGKTLRLDGAGKDLSPMQSVLLAVGACSSVDVVEIMKKSRQTITGCKCELEAERAENPPRVFTKIHAHYIVFGDKIKESHLERAVKLSTEKYCSVMLMLNQTVDITTSFEVHGPIL